MKASKQCPKCSSLKVGYLEHVADKGHTSYEEAVVGTTQPHGNWLISTVEAAGVLEAYVCADCGFYETYVKDPSSVPFDKLQGFHWLNDLTGTGQPYR